MDFDLTDKQRKLCSATRKFAEENLGRDLVDRDHRGAIDESDWHGDWVACAKHGVLGLNVPVDYGGLGYDVVTTILVLEALGYGCRDNGLTLSLNGQIWAVQEPILSFGTDQQKKRYLPGMCDGSTIGAHGMTEYASGSNAAALETRAEKIDQGYILNGKKAYIGLGPSCDVALVFASTAPEKEGWGISAFLVDKDADGFSRLPPQQKMGLRTAPMGEIVFKDCFVPVEALLGREGAGMSIFQHAMEWERSFIFASHVGSMHRQLDECVAYARERSVFNQSIDNYQSITNRLADMKLRLESSRLHLYKVAWLKSKDRPCASEAALAKLQISEAIVASSLDAIRIHGGRGYLSEFGIERDLRDAAGGIIYSGTSDIQRAIIAQMLKNKSE